MSTQINNLKDDEVSADLRIKLLYNMIHTSAENPGKLITNYNKSDHPMMDILDKSIALGQSIERLENIPGVASIAKKIMSREELRQVNLKNKIDEGLKSIEKEKE